MEMEWGVGRETKRWREKVQGRCKGNSCVKVQRPEERETQRNGEGMEDRDRRAGQIEEREKEIQRDRGRHKTETEQHKELERNNKKRGDRFGGERQKGRKVEGQVGGGGYHHGHLEEGEVGEEKGQWCRRERSVGSLLATSPIILRETPYFPRLGVHCPPMQGHQVHGGAVCFGVTHVGSKVNKHTSPHLHTGKGGGWELRSLSS